MTQTLIGADGVMMTLSGRLEMSSFDLALEASQTVIEAYPGVGVPKQRIVLNGLRMLDVETLAPLPRPRVTVERCV